MEPIYLCKSYRSQPEVVNYVREYLTVMGFQVLEAPGKGEEYSKKNLEESLYLVIVPPQLQFKKITKKRKSEFKVNIALQGDMRKYLTVGRGQFMEVETFLEEFGNAMEDVFIIGDITDGLSIFELSDYEESGANDWKENFGELYLNGDEPIDLVNYDMYTNTSKRQEGMNYVTTRVREYLNMLNRPLGIKPTEPVGGYSRTYVSPLQESHKSLLLRAHSKRKK